MTEHGAAERAQLVTRIRDALARREGELGIEVIVEAGVVTLRGIVQTDGRRSRLGSLSRRVSDGLVVVNEIEVCPPDPPPANAEMETVP
jgi:osmotically-inducible protein OsmY